MSSPPRYKPKDLIGQPWLLDLARRAESLTEAERAAVTDSLAGVPVTSSKAHETRLYLARAKLRAAA